MTAILVDKETSDTYTMRKLSVTKEKLKEIAILNAYYELKNLKGNKKIFVAYEILLIKK